MTKFYRRHQMRRIAYAVTTSHSGRAVDTADVTGASLRLGHCHTGSDGGWGKGGYTMMPGPAGSSSPESGAARNAVTAAVSENRAAGNVAEATPSALADGDEFTVTADNGGAASTTDAGGGHRHRHHHDGLGG